MKLRKLLSLVLALALALTTLDLITEPGLLEKIKADHAQAVAAQDE